MTTPTATTPNSDEPLADKLHAVRVGVRGDLEVTRHLFRGVPYYILRDPLTFQSQRVGVADYEILIAIRNDHALGEIFEQLVRRGYLKQGDEEHFYQLVMSLHGLGFLHLPVSRLRGESFAPRAAGRYKHPPGDDSIREKRLRQSSRSITP